MVIFPATRWSLVLAAAEGETEAGSRAIEELCTIYRPAVYEYACMALKNATLAEDITQAFFVDFLARKRLEAVKVPMGSFRKVLMHHFHFVLLDYLKHERSVRKGGRVEHVSTTILAEGEVPYEEIDYRAFDAQWALTVLRESISRLQIEESRKKRVIPFEVMRGYLPGAQDQAAGTYDELASRYGLSVIAVKVQVSRLRQRFRELIDETLLDTLSSRDQLAEERQCLLGVLKMLS